MTKQKITFNRIKDESISKLFYSENYDHCVYDFFERLNFHVPVYLSHECDIIFGYMSSIIIKETEYEVEIKIVEEYENLLKEELLYLCSNIFVAQDEILGIDRFYLSKV